MHDQFLVEGPELSEIDALILRLHTEGETAFEAAIRAQALPGADYENPDFLFNVAEGRVLLKGGAAVPLPRLDSAGIARIASWYLQDHEMEVRIVRDALKNVRQGFRISSNEIRDSLQRAGYRVGGTRTRRPPGFDYSRYADLTEQSGVNVQKLRRIAGGQTKTVTFADAEAILEALDSPHDMQILADKYELQLDEIAKSKALEDWSEDRRELEYVHLAMVARRDPTWFSDEERRCLEDQARLYALTQDKTFPRLGSAERRAEAKRRFVEIEGRDPRPIPPPLHERAQESLRHDKALAKKRLESAQKGLRKTQCHITAAAIVARTYRLRKRGVLPEQSRPQGYTP